MSSDTRVAMLRLPRVLVQHVVSFLDADCLKPAAAAVAPYRKHGWHELLDALHKRHLALEYSLHNVMLKSEALGPLFRLNGSVHTYDLSRIEVLLELHSKVLQLARKSGVVGVPSTHGLRTGPVFIVGSTISPPPAHTLAGLLQTLVLIIRAALPVRAVQPLAGKVDTQRTKWRGSQATLGLSGPAISELLGFVYWFVSYVHPFDDGNGRTAHLLVWLLYISLTRGAVKSLDVASLKGKEMRGVIVRILPNPNLEEYLDCHRVECRQQLIRALRDADGKWRDLSGAHKAALLKELKKPRRSAKTSQPTSASASARSQHTTNRPVPRGRATGRSAFQGRSAAGEEHKHSQKGGVGGAGKGVAASSTAASKVTPGTAAAAIGLPSPWLELGRFFLNTAWDIPSSKLVTSRKCYRWQHDYPGGEYSSGITWMTAAEAAGNPYLRGETKVDAEAMIAHGDCKYAFDEIALMSSLPE